MAGGGAGGASRAVAPVVSRKANKPEITKICRISERPQTGAATYDEGRQKHKIPLLQN
jgi:hypothetical protein